MAVVPPSSSSPAVGWPGLNLWRDGDNIVAEGEVPGFRHEDLEILATEDTLTIRGQRAKSVPENANALRVERSVRRFERSVQLPIQINAETVQATLADGVLRLTMPVVEAARPRRIPLKAIQPAQSQPALTGSPASAKADNSNK